jgi:hypothetical protein
LITSLLADPDSKKQVIICSKSIQLKEQIFSKIKIENPKK